MSKPVVSFDPNSVMSVDLGRAVAYLKLHSEYFVQDLGPITTTLSSVGGGAKFPDLKMYQQANGVYCTATGVSGNGKGKKFEFFIPYGNITGLTYAK